MSITGTANGNVNRVETVIDVPASQEEKDNCYICLEKKDIPKKVAQFACNELKHNICNDCYPEYKIKNPTAGCPICRAGSVNQILPPLADQPLAIHQYVSRRRKILLFLASNVIVDTALGTGIGYAVGGAGGAIIGSMTGSSVGALSPLVVLILCPASRIFRFLRA